MLRNTKISKSVHCPKDRVGVKSCKYQVTCFSSLNRISSGIYIAYFTENDYIGVSPHKCPQSPGEVQANTFIDVYLPYVWNVVLHRVFCGVDCLPKPV
ncbi:hypothetical protein D3C73_1328780 [compost metagenome]